MQLSSSVTKGDFAIKGQKKKISTEYNKYRLNEENREVESSYKFISEEIIEEANRQKEKIILEAMEKAKIIEKEAYDEGYNQGYINGVEDGKREVNEHIIPRAREISDDIIRNAEEMLKKATEDYNDYLLEKRDNIIDLAFFISEKILNNEILNKESFLAMIEKALLEAKGEETILIRCNREDVSYIEEKIEEWKITLGVKEGIFIIQDNLKRGEIKIEKETGIIDVGIKVGLEKIKSELFEGSI